MQSSGVIELGEVKFFEIGWPEKVWRMIKRVSPALKKERTAATIFSWRNALTHLNKTYYEISFSRMPGPSNSLSYDRWIEQLDTLSEDDRLVAAERASALPWKLTISVIMPVYNTLEEFLRKAIDSVRSQIYPYWELCIADDASTEPHIRPVLQEYANKDARIRIVYRETNGHISAASNSALSLATGDFAAFMDHDDVLSDKALYCVAAALNDRPDADIIYSDEDKVDESGMRFNPHFKPDWNPELFFSVNYISHFTTVRMDLVKHVGGFREGLGGAQDYDLLLRCLERTEARKILHIPEILYHWRTVSGSTALHPDEKRYAVDSGVRALSDYFRKRDPDVRVEPLSQPTTYRLRHSIPKPAPRVSIIIPTKNNSKILSRCIASIRKRTDYPDYEIIIVDNQSQEAETLAYLEELRDASSIKVLRFDYPFNFSEERLWGYYMPDE